MSQTAMPAPPVANAVSPATGRLEGLDGLRGIAALCVLWFHATGLFQADYASAGRGYLAVDFFFMLSGYVMARTYEHRFAAGYGAGSFLVARFRKLWPFMAVGALIGVPIVAIQLSDPLETMKIAAANVFLVPSFGTSELYPVNIAAWSILAELFANLIHGLLLWRMPNRLLALFAVGLVPLACWIGYSFGGLAVGADTATTHLGFIRALLPYCIGVLLWRWWRDQPTFRINPVWALAAMPLLVLAIPVGLTVPWAYDLAFALLVCPLLMAGGLAYTGSNAMLRWIGGISFPIYAINLPLLLWSKALGLGMVTGLALSLALAAWLAMRSTSRPPRAGPQLSHAQGA